MSKTFRPYEPDQIILMPASMRDWLPSDHLAYFISDVVDHLFHSHLLGDSLPRVNHACTTRQSTD